MNISRLLAATMVAGQPEPHAGAKPAAAARPANAEPGAAATTTAPRPGTPSKPRS
jgi:hypothetical protein